jgi:hypothetical protein
MNYCTSIIELDSDTIKSKNKVLKDFVKSDFDYIFLIESNCKVLDESIYDKFINVSEKTGIEVLCWGEGGLNKRLPFDDDPYIDYYTDLASAFVMYTRHAIKEVGFLDEKMPPNTWQELEHAKRIGDKGLSTPFGMFASPKGITELKLTSNKDEFENLEQMEEALKYWESRDQEDFPIQIKDKPKQIFSNQPITEMR